MLRTEVVIGRAPVPPGARARQRLLHAALTSRPSQRYSAGRPTRRPRPPPLEPDSRAFRLIEKRNKTYLRTGLTGSQHRPVGRPVRPEFVTRTLGGDCNCGAWSLTRGTLA